MLNFLKYNCLTALLIIACSAIIACGNKGDLYSPEPNLPAAEAPLPPKVALEDPSKKQEKETDKSR